MLDIHCIWHAGKDSVGWHSVVAGTGWDLKEEWTTDVNINAVNNILLIASMYSRTRDPFLICCVRHQHQERWVKIHAVREGLHYRALSLGLVMKYCTNKLRKSYLYVYKELLHSLDQCRECSHNLNQNRNVVIALIAHCKKSHLWFWEGTWEENSLAKQNLCVVKDTVLS